MGLERIAFGPVSDDTDKPATPAPAAHEPPAAAEISATWTSGDDAVAYTARAEWLVLRKKEKPAAEIFSVAYVADDAGTDRPITFVFNGGPGAASAYLHMGAVGPTRVDLPPDGSLPAMPARLVTNESSWLSFTDLVFVDPVGTGFSRVIESEKPEGTKETKEKSPDALDPKEYFGTKRDLESLCEFMSRWLSSRGRWGSPIVIAGESYGGYRVGRLMRMLQESAGIGLSGAILISPALEITSLDPSDYDVVGWIDTLPTMAAAALHHGRSRAFPPGTALEVVLAEAETFATGEYATLLTRGAAMPAADRDRILARQADLIGLPHDVVRRAEGRIAFHSFARELLRDERKVLGLLRRDDHRHGSVPRSRAVRRPRPDPRRIDRCVHDGGQPAAAARRSASRRTASTSSSATRSSPHGGTTETRSTRSRSPPGRPTTSATGCRSTRTSGSS